MQKYRVWILLMVIGFITYGTGCATTVEGEDSGDSEICCVGDGDGDNGGDGGPLNSSVCDGGASSSVPATLPGDFPGVVFTPLGDALGFDLVDLEFLPGQGGEAIAIGLDGTVYYLRNDLTVLGTTRSIAVGTEFEQGLLNVAADPGYDGSSNKAVYFYRTVPGGASNQVVKYFIDNVDTGNPGSFDLTDEQVIMDFPKNQNPQFGNNHNGGGMLFDTVGNLIVGVGDGGGAGSTNEQLAISQDPAVTLGKLHRFVPIPGATGVAAGLGTTYDLPTLPLDDLNEVNPFGSDTIYMYGFRNPFTVVGKEKNDQLLGDVGSHTYEEINCIYHAGENFGWPFFEGPTGGLQGFEPAAHGYCHNDSTFADQDPDAVVTGSRSIMVLAFIEAGDPVYGPDLDRRVLYSDFYVGFVRALRVETNHIKSGDDPIGHMPGLTNLQFHPVDGKLYGTSLGGSNQVLRMDLAP